MAGEAPLGPIHAHAPRVPIDLEPPEAQDTGRPGPIPPPQDRAQAGQQLPGLEGLGEVVVGADLQPDDAVHRIAARGQHEHRHVGERAELPAHLEAVHVGQHEVEHQRVVGLGGQTREPGPAVPRDRHREARLAEILGDHLGEAAVVLD